MSIYDYLNTGIASSIFIVLIFIGRKVESLDAVQKDVDSLTTDMKDVRERLSSMEVRMSVFEGSLDQLKQFVYKHAIK